MWDLDEHGGASFRVSGWHLQVDYRPDGLRLSASNDGSQDCLAMISLSGGVLPGLGEQFIRGDELHLSMPQAEDGQAGLDLVLLVIKADRDCLVIESTLSIQTLLLDAHPQVELTIATDGPYVQAVQESAAVFTRSPSAKVQTEMPSVSILVDRRDELSINNENWANGKLTFFGDFMEKGVIRKSQPWWVWATTTPDPARLKALAEELSERPLPLTS